MYSITFLVFVLFSVPFIWCELSRNDINISSPPIAGGIIPSKSISVSTSTGTKLLPSMEERKQQNITLKTPFLSVSVKNTTDGSTNEGDSIADTLANLVDKSNQNLLLGPEQMINPEDIMLDLDIPVRLTELKDLTEVSSVDQFKQKLLRSSLLEELFENIEGKEKYYSALKNLASGLRAKRTKRQLDIVNEARIDNKPQKHHNANTVVHKIFYHYPKKTNSDFVYKPESSGPKIRRDASSGVFFNPSMRSDVVGGIHHLPPFIPPHVPIRAPILPHHPVHHLPRIPPPPPLPIIPPAVLAQIIRARARHPLPPLVPIRLLPMVPQIARSIGILPSQLFPSLAPYADEEDIIIARGRGNPMVSNLRNILPVQQMSLPFTPGYPILQHLRSSSEHPILRSISRYPFLDTSRFNGPIFEPVHRRIDVGDPRSIFNHFPPIRRNSNQNQHSPVLQLPNGYFPYQQTVIKNRYFPQTYNRPHMNMISHQPLAPMPVTYTRIPRTIHQMNNGDPQEVLESLERTGNLLGNTFFSLIGHMPTITR